MYMLTIQHDSEGVVLARDSAQYTKVHSLVHTLERDQKRFCCNSPFHGFNRVQYTALCALSTFQCLIIRLHVKFTTGNP